MRSSSSRRSTSSSAAIRVCVGSPGTFSTRRCWSATLAIWGRCVIVSTCARSARRRRTSGHTVRGHTADAGIDLVEDDRLASRDGRDRERDARELAARGRLGDGRERKPGVRADEEDRLVDARRPRRRAHAARRGTRPRPARDPRAPAATAAANGTAAPRRATASAAAAASNRSRARPPDRLRARSTGSPSAPSPSSSLERNGAAFEEIVEGRRAVAARGRPRCGRGAPRPRPREPGPRRARRRSACRSLPTSPRRTATSRSSAAAAELRREPLERRERTLGRGGKRARSLSVVRLDRRGSGLRPLRELRDVAEPLALGAERVLLARHEPLGVLDERRELLEPRALRAGPLLELDHTAATPP